MHREPHRTARQVLEARQQRRATPEIAALPKGAKKLIGKGIIRHVVYSPSLPHSKFSR